VTLRNGASGRPDGGPRPLARCNRLGPRTERRLLARRTGISRWTASVAGSVFRRRAGSSLDATTQGGS